MQPDTTQLQSFVDAAKSKGASDEFLASFLTRRGWPAGDVYAALGDYWQRVTGVAIPERAAAGESSRDAFLYLLSFSTLATWATALGSMLFEFINHWLPDTLARGSTYGMYSDLRLSVTWQMASIAVAFPIYLTVMRTILKEAANNPERLLSGVRKWLTWIALLITAGSMMCDLIWFLDYFLTGELTMRFVLKAAVVFLICGAIFAYYIASLRWTRNTPMEREKSRSAIFAGCAALVVGIAFAIGLGVAGTPNTQRRVEADARRVQDLRTIANNPRMQSRLRDPETNQPYEYRAQSGANYEVCANFNFASPENGTTSFWNHKAGRNCFELDRSRVVPW